MFCLKFWTKSLDLVRTEILRRRNRHDFLSEKNSVLYLQWTLLVYFNRITTHFYDCATIECPFIFIFTGLNVGLLLQLHSKFQGSTPILIMHNVGNGSRLRGWKYMWDFFSLVLSLEICSHSQHGAYFR